MFKIFSTYICWINIYKMQPWRLAVRLKVSYWDKYTELYGQQNVKICIKVVLIKFFICPNNVYKLFWIIKVAPALDTL